MPFVRLPWRSTRKRQAEFNLRGQGTVQSDHEFFQRASPDGSPDEKKLLIEIRQIIAEFCRCPRGMIRAEEDTRVLEDVMAASTFCGWFISLGDHGPDDLYFNELQRKVSMHLERRVYLDVELRVRARDKWTMGGQLGKWASWLVREILEAFP